MKRLIKICFVFFWTSSFSQTIFPKPQNKVSEIHFVYEKKSNYLIGNDGVYADTLLFKVDFPDVKYLIKTYPKDTTKTYAFVNFKEFGNKNKSKLSSILYHTNETMYGMYSFKKNITNFKVIRGNEETKKIIKTVFKEPFYDFSYSQIFDFNKEIYETNYPNVSYSGDFSKIEHNIIFNDQNFGIGEFYEIINNIEFKNIIYTDTNLFKYISPYVFKNNGLGISKIEKIKETIILKSVIYK